MLTGTSRYEVETPLPASRAAYAARRESSHREPEQPIVGESDSLKYVMSCVERVADTDATVLLSGETGTGKELVARALHQRSRRRNQPFVIVNCAAMPATLIESELFGRERGAFTDATVTQAGRFEVAHRGTLFLDEIGELPHRITIQAAARCSRAARSSVSAARARSTWTFASSPPRTGTCRKRCARAASARTCSTG